MIERPLTGQKRPDRLPLSYAQQRLWFIDQLSGTSAEYNFSTALRLRGRLDREVLRQAISTIVERHEVLRTRFAEVDGQPVQVIDSSRNVELRMEDLSELEENTQQEAVLKAMRREASAALDLTTGPVFSVKLVKVNEQEHVLLWTVHHIAYDLWSEGVFQRELRALYEAYRNGSQNPLKPLEMQYADFALWQRLDDGVWDAGLKYWREQLIGIPDRLKLPTDRARPPVQTFEASVSRSVLSADVVSALKSLGRQNRVTLYMTMLAAFGILLSRYTGTADIVVGTPIANRQGGLEGLIGLFANTLLMRLRLSARMSVRELLAEVKKTAIRAYENPDVPFERLVQELSPQRNQDTTLLYQVVFALQKVPAEGWDLKDLDVQVENPIGHRVRTELEVHAWEQGKEVAITWIYRQDLFDLWRMEQMARHYVRVLEIVIADSDQALGRIDFLDPEERRLSLGLS